MRKLSFASLVALVAAGCVVSVFAGCGSESEDISNADGGNEGSTEGSTNDGTTPPPADGGTDGNFIDAIVDGGRSDATTCKNENDTCTVTADCCSANCDKTTGKCGKPLNNCALPGKACAAGPDCCTFSCISGLCADKQCVADNQACGADSECCAGSCVPDGVGGGKCAPLVPGGPAAGGNPCTMDGDCASKFCNNGTCSPSSYCQQNGDSCNDNIDCCGGQCTKQAGKVIGVCGQVAGGGAGGCEPSGTLCTGNGVSCGGNCCSRSCAPFGPSGKTICQPTSGCQVLGNLCRANSDCCGWEGGPEPKKGPYECVKATPGQEYGICGKGNACTEPGTICGKALESDGVTVGVCNASNNCCEKAGQGNPVCNTSPEKCCRRDALGVPRCIIDYDLDCTNNPPAAGATCATSADCCGKPCVNGVCLGACVPSAGECTVTADCCTGIQCIIPPGASKGFCGGSILPDGGVSPDGGADGGGPVTNDAGVVCALYGQACAASSECCNGVPCTGGTCRYP